MKTIDLVKRNDEWMIDEEVLKGLEVSAKYLLRTPHVRNRFTSYKFGKIQAKSQEDFLGEVFYILFSAKELGISFTQALQGISIIKDKPAMSAELMLALVYRSNEITSFVEVLTGSLEGGDAKYTCTVQRGTLEKVVRSFSIDDAKRAGLWVYDDPSAPKVPWKTYPLRMLQMRARSTALRDGFSDVVKGFTSEEEAQDIPSDPTPDKITKVETEVIEHPVVSKMETTDSEPKSKVTIHDSKMFKGEQYVVTPDGSYHLSSGIIYTKLDLADMTSMNEEEKKRMYQRKLAEDFSADNKFPIETEVSTDENVTVA